MNAWKTSMSRIRFFLIVGAFAALSFAGDLVAAQRTFVSAAQGNDTNPCSRALPCRNFTAALLQTATDGEVVVLDSGGYGVVTITRSVSLISPTGVHAGITALSDVAVTVNAGDSAHVVLRNLAVSSLNSGAVNGIYAETVAALYVENCSIGGFANGGTATGIRFEPTTADARLYVSNTTVARSDMGIVVIGTGIRATLDSVWLHGNVEYGALVYGAEVTFRKSVASGQVWGFVAASDSKMIFEDSVSTMNDVGVFAWDGGVVMLTRCTIASNTYAGIRIDDANGMIYVSGSTITGNGIGVHAFGTAVVRSRGNNTLQGNTSNGSFTEPGFPPN
jgi:parallel beta helix pectate lyase-like protein